MIIDGIQINIVYKRVKKITLKVDNNCQVLLVCRRGLSKDYLQSFALKNIDWIKQTLAKKSLSPSFSKDFLSGDKITIWGKDYILKVIKGDKNSIVKTDNEIVMFVRDLEKTNCEKVYKKWAKDEVDKIIKSSIEKWESVTSLKCSNYAIKDMKSRWGSCNIKTKKLAFSIHLLSQNVEQIDYVVLHELAHIIHAKHDRDFYSFISKFMPQYKQISKGLCFPVCR